MDGIGRVAQQAIGCSMGCESKIKTRTYLSDLLWTNAMPNRFDDTKTDSAIGDYMTLHSLALDIADHAARSEIELYSLQTCEPDGRRVFDTQKPREESVDQESVSIAAKALRYIEMRGSALPYRLRRSGALIWFEEHALETSLAG